MTPTILFNLVLGGITSVLASIMSITAMWLPGSAVLGGHLFQDSTNNASPSIYVNSGAVMTVGGTSANKAGGGIPLTASGVTTGWLVAHYQVPAVYGSGAVIKDLYFDCNGIGRTVSGSLVVNHPAEDDNITRGTMIFRNVSLSTGSTVDVSNLFSSGSVLTNTKLADAHYVSFISNASGSNILPPTRDCVMRPILREKYGR